VGKSRRSNLKFKIKIVDARTPLPDVHPSNPPTPTRKTRSLNPRKSE
jgi:hypothetical protein